MATFLRTLATPTEIEIWSLTSLRERLIKTGARLVPHARSAVILSLLRQGLHHADESFRELL